MAQQETTTHDKLLVFGITGAFMSLTIVLGYFLSPGSWSPAIATAAASYLVVSIVVAAGAGIRVLYRDWKTPPRHRVGDSAVVLQAGLAVPSTTHAALRMHLNPGLDGYPRTHSIVGTLLT